MTLLVDRYELGPIRTNCYVVRREDVAEAVVVDPSGDAPQIAAKLERMGVACAAILVTHTDWDHLLAVAELAETTGAPVYAPRDERERLADPGSAGHRVPVRAHDPEHLVTGGETIEVAGIAFEVIDLPGHTPGHVGFYAEGELFSGDVLFAGGVGRTDRPGASFEQLLASIKTLTERFPADTVVHSGHGPETTLGDELARNPFLAELRP